MHIDSRKVNPNSLSIGGVDRKDHPKFCDAYFASGHFENGNVLNDVELDQLTDNYPMKLNEMAHESLI